jgi:ferredoxin-NADP reductase
MAEFQMTLMDRQRIARDTMAFWFDTNGARYQFRAGQHADFTLLHPSPEHEGDNSRTFSLANSPQDKGQVMIALRMRETGFKTALKAAALGTKLQVSSPRGSFTLHKDATRPAVFLAGGIGITPMRSILHWAAQERLPHKLYLFYSNRHLEDAAFLGELEDLAIKNPFFKFIPTLTGVESPAWPYEHDAIDHGLLTRYLRSLHGPVYYAAGPSGMVAAMTGLLHSAGVSDDDIKTEEFGDYKQYQSPRQISRAAMRCSPRNQGGKSQ